MYDLIVKGAKLATTGETADVAVSDGIIAKIGPDLDGEAGEVIDAVGMVVSMGLVDSHIHADKALIADRIGERARVPIYTDHIMGARKVKETFTVDDVRERATKVFRAAVAYGTTTMRTQVELDPIVGTVGAEGVIQAIKDCEDIIDVQTVSFPQEGWEANDLELDCRPYVRKGLELGLNYVGGNMNPSWPSDMRVHIDDAFKLADEFGVGVDIHLDNIDNGVGYHLPHVVRRTKEYGLEGQVTVSHLVGLDNVPEQLMVRAIEWARDANIHVCSLPARIRLTPIKKLMDGGVNLVIGTDNMQDMFTGLGRADMLEMALLLARVTKMTRPKMLEGIFATITTNGIKALELEAELGLEEGKRADLVVLDAPTVGDAIRDTATRTCVIKRGKVVARDGELV